MEAVRQAIVILLVGGGLFFFAVGTLGLLRLPDALTRMHAATKADTLGAGMALFGLAVSAGLQVASLKVLLIIAFIWLTNPTATHVIAKAAYRDPAFPPLIGERIDLDGVGGDES